jgi:hypothetical protein
MRQVYSFGLVDEASVGAPKQKESNDDPILTDDPLVRGRCLCPTFVAGQNLSQAFRGLRYVAGVSRSGIWSVWCVISHLIIICLPSAKLWIR